MRKSIDLRKRKWYYNCVNARKGMLIISNLDFDVTKLKIKMLERNVTDKQLIDALGINESTYYKKKNKITEFKRNELKIIKFTLHLNAEEMDQIFFA